MNIVTSHIFTLLLWLAHHSCFPAAVSEMVAVVGVMVVAGMAVGVEGKMGAAGMNDSNK